MKEEKKGPPEQKQSGSSLELKKGERSPGTKIDDSLRIQFEEVGKGKIDHDEEGERERSKQMLGTFKHTLAVLERDEIFIKEVAEIVKSPEIRNLRKSLAVLFEQLKKEWSEIKNPLPDRKKYIDWIREDLESTTCRKLKVLDRLQSIDEESGIWLDDGKGVLRLEEMKVILGSFFPTLSTDLKALREADRNQLRTGLQKRVRSYIADLIFVYQELFEALPKEEGEDDSWKKGLLEEYSENIGHEGESPLKELSILEIIESAAAIVGLRYRHIPLYDKFSPHNLVAPARDSETQRLSTWVDRERADELQIEENVVIRVLQPAFIGTRDGKLRFGGAQVVIGIPHDSEATIEERGLFKKWINPHKNS